MSSFQRQISGDGPKSFLLLGDFGQPLTEREALWTPPPPLDHHSRDSTGRANEIEGGLSTRQMTHSAPWPICVGVKRWEGGPQGATTKTCGHKGSGSGGGLHIARVVLDVRQAHPWHEPPGQNCYKTLPPVGRLVPAKEAQSRRTRCHVRPQEQSIEQWSIRSGLGQYCRCVLRRATSGAS